MSVSATHDNSSSISLANVGKRLANDVLQNCSAAVRPVREGEGEVVGMSQQQVVVGVEFEIFQINSLDVVHQVTQITFLTILILFK